MLQFILFNDFGKGEILFSQLIAMNSYLQSKIQTLEHGKWTS